MNPYDIGAQDLEKQQRFQQPSSAQESSYPFPSGRHHLLPHQAPLTTPLNLSKDSTYPVQGNMLTFNQHHLNNQYPQRMNTAQSLKKPDLLQSTAPILNTPAGTNNNGLSMHQQQQQPMPPSQPQSQQQQQQQQALLQQQMQQRKQQQTQQQPQPQQQQQHPYPQRQFGNFETPSPPTPSPSPGNHPTVHIPHPKLQQLEMSQNSPSGEQASSPSLSASSPTSTTSTTKKRTRASVEQLAILEDTFLTNQSPNSKVREILAKKVKMSERSIQIWFQNRRAKVKQAQKRSELVQQEAMKAQYLSNCAAAGITPQPIYGFGGPIPVGGPKGYGHLHPAALARAPLSRSTSYDARATAVQARFGPTGLGINVPGAANPALWGAQNPYGMQPPVHPGFGFRPNVPQVLTPMRGVKRSFDGVNGPLSVGAVPKPLHFPSAVSADGLTTAEGSASSDLMFMPTMVPGSSQIPTLPTFNCDNLAIGTWRRMSTTNTDLSCFYCPTTKFMTWQIVDNGARFKMTFPLSSISRIEYYEVDPMYSQVDFDLIETPQFYMETVSEDQQRDWKKCSDFTEAKQATLVMRHTIHGLSAALKMQVMSLTIAYPPLQAITQYREPQFPTQFHAYTAPIPQIPQFLDPSQYDRRFVTPMHAGSYLAMNDGIDSEGSDLEDLYDGTNGYGMPMTSTTHALLNLGSDGQSPRPKSRRTASMPTPGMNNLLTAGLNTVPYHSSPLSMYSTTGVNLETLNTSALTTAATAAAVAAAASSAASDASVAATAPTATATPSSLPATTSSTSPLPASAMVTGAGSAETGAINGINTTAPTASLAPSMIATATTMPKVTITTLSDSVETTPGSESTTVVHGEGEKEEDRNDTIEGDEGERSQKPGEMGLTSQFNEFLAQAVVSNPAPMSTGFVPSGLSQGMMYGVPLGQHAQQTFQLGSLDDGADGYDYSPGYYGIMPEQASFVSMSDLEGSTGQQTDGEESSYGY